PDSKSAFSTSRLSNSPGPCQRGAPSKENPCPSNDVNLLASTHHEFVVSISIGVECHQDEAVHPRLFESEFLEVLLDVLEGIDAIAKGHPLGESLAGRGYHVHPQQHLRVIFFLEFNSGKIQLNVFLDLVRFPFERQSVHLFFSSKELGQMARKPFG